MSVIDAPALAVREIAPVASKTRRWIRRYGLPALGDTRDGQVNDLSGVFNAKQYEAAGH